MKYFALALGAVLLGEATLLLFIKPAASSASSASSATVSEVNALKSVEAQIKRLEALQTAVDGMDYSAAFGQTSEPIVAWNDEPPPSGQEQSAGRSGQGEQALPPERKLTLIFTSGQAKSAMIDGVYVRVGDRLPDGGKVIAIRSDAVVLVDAYGRHVLSPAPRQLDIGVVR